MAFLEFRECLNHLVDYYIHLPSSSRWLTFHIFLVIFTPCFLISVITIKSYFQNVSWERRQRFIKIRSQKWRWQHHYFKQYNTWCKVWLRNVPWLKPMHFKNLGPYMVQSFIVYLCIKFTFRNWFQTVTYLMVLEATEGISSWIM